MESHTPIIIFNFLAASGFALLLATLFPALLSSRIHRSKAWFSMIFSWIIYALSYLLIIGHQLGPEPPRGICVYQMVLIYACPPLTAMSGLAFIIDVHFRVTGALFTSQVDHRYTQSLLLVPWASFVAVASGALIAVQDFADVSRNSHHMYCHSTTSVQYLTTALICVFALFVALCMITWTATILYRNWALFRRLSVKQNDLRLSSLIRVAIFSMMTSIGLGLGAFSAFRGNATEGDAIWGALLPILPFLCAIAFGTQRDIVRCWMFRKPRTEGADASMSTPHV
ncbi:hypothetical protein B0H15DRAFT_6734 [Mycena belliarum]|uniref:Uncharacterized protein n=1 Tax=Mycena belliarum TaxID=1033014 RepID=A0AAD6XY48_9AGAR|nr:hypothetical protein B0H15DRAFT_6734 [Mycena belliae]